MADPENRWDDDDWTGEPPEGRYDASRADPGGDVLRGEDNRRAGLLVHCASRADPGFWRQSRAPLSITGAGVGIALIVLVVVWLL